MDTTTMRRLDARIGAPLCKVLTWHRRVARERPGRGGAPRRIVIVKLAEQGATVVAIAALRTAVEMVGRDNVFMVVFEENRFILDELGVIPDANVLTVRTDSPVHTATSTLRVLRRLRHEQVDAAADLEFFSRASAIVTYLSGASIRSGYHSWFGEGSDRGDLMTHRLACNATAHASQSFLAPVLALTRPAGSLPALPEAPTDPTLHQPPRSTVTDAEISAARQLVTAATRSAATGPIILLNANTSDLIPLRQWPTGRYVELARVLLERNPTASVVFTGSPQEAAAAKDLADQVGSTRCASVAGRTTMHGLLALYSAAEVLVTNDSGPAHYATLTSIDVVTLFGPETPAVFGARTPRSHHLWAGLPCSPCVNAFNDRQTACRNNLCMQAITVEHVASVVDQIVTQRGAPSRRGDSEGHQARASVAAAANPIVDDGSHHRSE